MKTIGVVAEFNPFHEGHRFLFDKAKDISGGDRIVCVMSGDFIQRGGPAVFDKWERARSAVEGGADLILELPVIYSGASAGYFAKGAVAILEGLGAVDLLAFGSESGNIDELRSAAAALKEESEEQEQLIKAFLKEGHSYPKARFMALNLGKEYEELFTTPNNILALEYLAVTKLPAVTVKREGAGHLESGRMIREKLLSQDEKCFREREMRYFDLVRGVILRESWDYLESISSSGEGLGNKLKNEIRYASSLDDLIARVKSKRYTETRIRRLLAQVLLGITEDSVAGAKPYIRPLAFNKTGADILREVRDGGLNTIPIVDNYGKTFALGMEDLNRTIEKDFLATDMYGIIWSKDLYHNSDLVKKPIYVEDKTFNS